MFKNQALIDAYLKTVSTNRIPLAPDKLDTIRKVKAVQKERMSNIA